MGETGLDFAVDAPFDDADLSRSQHHQGGRRITAWIAIAATCAMALLVLSLRQPVSPPLFPESFPTPTGLLGYWTGDTSSLVATTGPDLTGSTTYVDGVIGKAFDLSANQLATTQLPSVSDAVSVMMWVKPSPNAKSPMSLATRSTGPGLTGVLDDRHSFDLWLDPSGALVWQTDDVSSRVPEELRASVPTIFDGAFHLVAATWDTTAFNIYMDGTLIASKASQGGPLHAAPTTPFRLGGGFAYAGAIDNASVWSRTLSPSEVSTYYLGSITSLSVGTLHSCALSTGGSVKCWGNNQFGALGNGTTTNSNVPVSVVGIASAVAVSAGYSHSCALIGNGTIRCWGNNSYGQLGDGTGINSATPVTVTGITNATAISTGGIHTCALLADATIKCWGYNGFGQLGNGTNTSSGVPVAVTGVTNAAAVSASRAAGDAHTCALLIGGGVKCWGYGSAGQLGTGGNYWTNLPVDVVGISNATVISAGIFHSCAILSDATIKCWGRQYPSTPTPVPGITNATAISTAHLHSCALRADGTVLCWGSNNWGQLGDGTYNSSNSPVTVAGITNAIGISVGEAFGREHSCALLSDNTIKCWGNNFYGQLGNGSNITSSNTPVGVVGL